MMYAVTFRFFFYFSA
ncbi:pheST operon leader peptide PheM [Yersinia enterocolitica]